MRSTADRDQVPAKVESMIARGVLTFANFTSVTPRYLPRSPAGTANGPGDLALPGSGCGKAVDRRVESHVPLHFLHDLMDVTVENGHAAETLQVAEGPGGVLGSPAPFRIHNPQRDVGKDHDRCRCRQTFDVILQPFELFVAEIAETARFQIDHVDKPDEVDAVLIKAVPTRPFRPLAVALQVGLAGALVDHIVLARHIECGQSGCLDRFGVVEFRVLRKVKGHQFVAGDRGVRVRSLG
jgi:hypothetical protein